MGAFSSRGLDAIRVGRASICLARNGCPLPRSPPPPLRPASCPLGRPRGPERGRGWCLSDVAAAAVPFSWMLRRWSGYPSTRISGYCSGYVSARRRDAVLLRGMLSSTVALRSRSSRGRRGRDPPGAAGRADARAAAADPPGDFEHLFGAFRKEAGTSPRPGEVTPAA